MATRPITLEFIKSRCTVDPRSECWTWMNYTDKSGYGRIHVCDESKWVHRVTWELVNGPIPARKKIYRECDTLGCCNPAHLLVGSQTHVIRLAKHKGRTSAGLRHSIAITPTRRARAKLSLDIARQIRSLQAAGTSQRRLAEQFSISRYTVNAILAFRIWREKANIFGL